MKQLSLLFLLLLLCSSPSPSSSLNSDTINPNKPLLDGDVLVSSGQIFALGFFSPQQNPIRRYLGIWYHRVSQQTVVWVANRDTPLNDTSGHLALSSTGNLNLYAGNGTYSSPIWSANLSTGPVQSLVLQLLDSGNLVLLGEGTGKVLWQSFDYPTDHYLPFMKLGLDKRTGLDRFVTSSKSENDPDTGTVTYRIDPIGYPQLFLYKNRSVPLWRVGPWTGVRWSGVPEVSYVNDDKELSIMYGVTVASVLTRMYVTESGMVKRATWIDHDRRWNEFWYAPKEECDRYRTCGQNSNCDPRIPDAFHCKCLPGDGSDGCVRKAGTSTCRSGEGFVKVENVKVPDTSAAHAEMAMGLKACEEECLKNCTCVAYTSADERGFGCLRWYGDLVDTRSYSGGGQNIYVRVDAKVLAFFHLSEIAAATNNFSEDNKLGEGGFGSVYKGTYKGNEIAVKRLSKYSGQGAEEFKNEVELLAKLQHRNLVKILGCCIQGSEKMLVYEYLPNKSLDYFIFDEDKKASLNWPIRYNIICGIARGILYLHEDSRLRIIHRDLKASNVLLDASMNPKISDFGMARIFKVNQDQANTNRVVGTYGYMAPEYAMQGMFSVKSDVYSFGVLLLEIVAGRKNSSYYEETTSSSLIGYTWELWEQDRAMEIVDSSMGDSTYSGEDVLRCIQIGLLCVQELATDRPNMFDVVFMLSNIETTPPAPTKPAFILKASGTPLTSITNGDISVNDLTVTMLQPR
ncbi:G-type lectin S-receptor-like serine/threonine-protein kinase At4g27290 [Linum grandiflorum]